MAEAAPAAGSAAPGAPAAAASPLRRPEVDASEPTDSPRKGEEVRRVSGKDAERMEQREDLGRATMHRDRERCRGVEKGDINRQGSVESHRTSPER